MESKIDYNITKQLCQKNNTFPFTNYKEYFNYFKKISAWSMCPPICSSVRDCVGVIGTTTPIALTAEKNVYFRTSLMNVSLA